LALTDMV